MPLLLLQPPRGNGGSDDRKPSISDILDQYGLDRTNASSLRIAEKLVAVLGDNYDLRQKNGTLTTENSSLKTSAPKDGEIVIAKADADLLTAYKTEGTPDEFKKAKGDVNTLTTENTSLKETSAKNHREAGLRELASDLGLKAKPLIKLANDPELAPSGLEFFKKGVAVDGKTVETWHAKFTEGEGQNTASKEVVANDFINSTWEDWAPSLRAGDSGNNGGGGGNNGQNGSGGNGGGNGSGGNNTGGNTGGAIPFPSQGAGGGNNTGGMDTSSLDNFQNTRYSHALPQTQQTKK